MKDNVIKFDKPFTFEGEEIKSLTMRGLSIRDLALAEVGWRRRFSPPPASQAWFSMGFLNILAAFAADRPINFFEEAPLSAGAKARDFLENYLQEGAGTVHIEGDLSTISFDDPERPPLEIKSCKINGNLLATQEASWAKKYNPAPTDIVSSFSGFAARLGLVAAGLEPKEENDLPLGLGLSLMQAVAPFL